MVNFSTNATKSNQLQLCRQIYRYIASYGTSQQQVQHNTHVIGVKLCVHMQETQVLTCNVVYTHVHVQQFICVLQLIIVYIATYIISSRIASTLMIILIQKWHFIFNEQLVVKSHLLSSYACTQLHMQLLQDVLVSIQLHSMCVGTYVIHQTTK